MAKHLAREGAYVVILGRNEQKGSALVNEIKAEGGEALFLVSNVLDKALLEQNKQEILKAYGKIDVLVNLAGGNQAGATIPPDKTIFDLDIDAFRTVVDLNLFGTVLPTMVFVWLAMDAQKPLSTISRNTWPGSWRLNSERACE